MHYLSEIRHKWINTAGSHLSTKSQNERVELWSVLPVIYRLFDGFQFLAFERSCSKHAIASLFVHICLISIKLICGSEKDYYVFIFIKTLRSFQNGIILHSQQRECIHGLPLYHDPGCRSCLCFPSLLLDVEWYLDAHG